MQKKISIIVPIYNETLNIILLYEQLGNVMKSLSSYTYEIIFVDDGSTDNSWYLIAHIAQHDDQVKGIQLSRNFGHQMALTAGYDHATGDAIITIDADLQDPPSLMVQMIARWQQGFNIVYARRVNRQDPWLKRVTAYWYYWLFERVANMNVPRNVGDFRLIDRKVLAVLKQCKERHRYLRGMIAWMGFAHAFVDFNRAGRQHGESSYTWKKMIKLACDGFMSFSLLPLRIALLFGCLSMIISVMPMPNILLMILMGAQFLVLWILGEYVGRIYEQQQARPLYIIAQTINISMADNYPWYHVYSLPSSEKIRE